MIGNLVTIEELVDRAMPAASCGLHVYMQFEQKE